MVTERLFPIAPFGCGSADVESLASYIHRLAFEHGVSVGVLIRYLYWCGIKDGLISSEDTTASWASVNTLVRPCKKTNQIRDLLQSYTGNDLRGTIFWVLNNALGTSYGEIVKTFRWCPECLAEMESLNIEPYFKLIWHIKAITACPTHRTVMLEVCEFCGCDQTTAKKDFPISYCQSCGERLSLRKERLRPSDIRYSWEDIGFDVITFFNDLSLVEPNSFPNGAARESLSDLFDYYWENDREEEIYCVFTRDRFLAMIFNQRPVNLKSARRIAYQLGVSLFDLVSGQAAQTTDMLDHEQLCLLPPDHLRPSRKVKRDHVALLRKIRRVIKLSESPLSLKELARQTEMSVGYLQYRYPALTSDVVSKYMSYQEKKKLQKLYLAQRKALDFFIDEKYSRLHHSRKQAYKTLKDETGLPKFLLKRCIQNAYQATYS